MLFGFAWLPPTDQNDKYFQKREDFSTDGKIRLLRKRKIDQSIPDRTEDLKRGEKRFRGS